MYIYTTIEGKIIRYLIMVTMWLHTFSCNSGIIVHITVKIALSFTLCNYSTIHGAVILELPPRTCVITLKHHNFLISLIMIRKINCLMSKTKFPDTACVTLQLCHVYSKHKLTYFNRYSYCNIPWYYCYESKEEQMK